MRELTGWDDIDAGQLAIEKMGKNLLIRYNGRYFKAFASCQCMFGLQILITFTIGLLQISWSEAGIIACIILALFFVGMFELVGVVALLERKTIEVNRDQGMLDVKTDFVLVKRQRIIPLGAIQRIEIVPDRKLRRGVIDVVTGEGNRGRYRLWDEGLEKSRVKPGQLFLALIDVLPTAARGNRVQIDPVTTGCLKDPTRFELSTDNAADPYRKTVGHSIIVTMVFPWVFPSFLLVIDSIPGASSEVLWFAMISLMVLASIFLVIGLFMLAVYLKMDLSSVHVVLDKDKQTIALARVSRDGRHYELEYPIAQGWRFTIEPRRFLVQQSFYAFNVNLVSKEGTFTIHQAGNLVTAEKVKGVLEKYLTWPVSSIQDLEPNIIYVKNHLRSMPNII